MKRHTVDLQSLLDFKNHEWVSFASIASQHSHKLLEVGLCGFFRVIDRGEVVYIGDDPEKAVAVYNERD